MKPPPPPFPTHFVEDAQPIDMEVLFETAAGQRLNTAVAPLIAGTRGTWILRLTNRGPDLGEGAALGVARFNCQFAYELQDQRPAGRDFCTVECGHQLQMRLGLRRSSVNLLTLQVTRGVWRRGDQATVRLGDRRQGSVGSEVFWSATQGRLLLGVDARGDGTFRGVRGNPFDFRIVAHPQPRLLRLLGPSIVAVDEAFALHLGVFDRNGNPLEDFAGTVEFTLPPGFSGLPPRYAFSPADGGVRIFPNVRCRSQGVLRIRVSGAAGSFLSNPIAVRHHPDLRIYWGDVHAHGWGDSSMYLMHLRTRKLDPLQRLLQARDLGGHDFSCPGAMAMDPEQREQTWTAYREALAQVDAPGRFVPFLSYEAHPPAGDRQVIFRDDEPAAPPSMRLPMEELDALYGERDDVLLEVHTGGAPPLWDRYRPARERLLEVCSGFGAAEWLLQRALQLGYRPAVCGASDLHLGYLGGPRAVETFRGRFGQKYPMRQRDAAYGTGPLTAVRAPTLTRSALWESLTKGRTYATSGARIILDLSLNDSVTSTVLTAADLQRGLRLELECHACAPIRRLSLICGTYRLRAWEPDALDFHEKLVLTEAQLPGSWLYVRVEQTDGEYAWSRVVFLDDRTALPAAGALPAWNQEATPDLGDVEPNPASIHLPDLRNYLQREEELSRFHKLTPVGVERLAVGPCALFYCLWGDEQLPMSIRWFFTCEIPKIRYDFGWRDYGTHDELELGPRLMRRYSE